MKTRIPAALATAVYCIPALAQTPPTDTAMEQVMVTAARVPIDLRHIGSATSVFTRDDIERRQARYVTDLLRTVPGFAVSRSGGPGSQTQVRVRGAEANHVLVLIDGVRANDPATSDEFPWEQLSTGAVERIEIVRGAQSALWGSEAVAAVVNISTRGGRGSGSNASTYLEGGSNNTRNIGANGTLSHGPWTVDASAERLDTAGENISRIGAERDGAELASGHIGLRYADDSAVGFQASLRGTDSTSAFDPTNFATGLPGDADRITESGNVTAQLVGTLETHGGRVSWHARTAFFDSEHRNFADGAENSSTSSSRVTFTLQSD
ncbi:MAG: TonB-dependent receptor plug domain-containing protein, partial [Chromatocurvus sp.]